MSPVLSAQVKRYKERPSRKGVMKLAAGEGSILSVNCEVGGRKVEALLDTGASHSFISQQFANTLSRSLSLKESDGLHEFITAAGNPIRSVSSLRVSVKIFRFSWKFVFLVVPSLSQDVILGMNFLSHTKAIINPTKRSISFQFEPRLILKLPQAVPESNVPRRPVSNHNTINPNIDKGAQSRLREIINKYPSVVMPKLGK